ncbi:MAG: SDR family NAD(P)-dependent oxidoreductase [Pseudomonadales bacterium]
MSSRWGVKHAIISGGASGIGLAIAKALLADGANLTILDLNIPDAKQQELGAQKKAANQEILSVEVNIADAPSVRSAVQAGVEKFGAPDFALNCAGINLTGNFAHINDDDFARVINVNLLGSRNFAHAVLPHMQAGAQFALLASLGGILANYAYSAYSSSKFGVMGLANVLRTEYAAVGIGVSAICPPEVPTPMVAEEHKSMHPAQRALKDSGGVVDLVDLVPYVLDHALLKKNFLIIPGTQAKLMYWVSRLLPLRWFNAYVDRVVRQVFSQHPDAIKR